VTITLPEDLAWLLRELGFAWPSSDEDKMAELGKGWIALAQELGNLGNEANTTAAQVWEEHAGQDIEAFKTWWHAEDSPAKSIAEGVKGATTIGEALAVCAMVVIGLKLFIIAKLTAAVISIGVAIAAALETGGLSLLAIAAIKKVAKEAIAWAIEQAIFKLLEG
jgi:hypothetical protein